MFSPSLVFNEYSLFGVSKHPVNIQYILYSSCKLSVYFVAIFGSNSMHGCLFFIDENK